MYYLKMGNCYFSSNKLQDEQFEQMGHLYMVDEVLCLVPVSIHPKPTQNYI